MKKIILGILSILLIVPVFAYDINPGFSVYNTLSLSNYFNNNSVVYLQNNNQLFEKSSYGILTNIYNLPYSKNNIDYGVTIDSENITDSYIFSGVSNYSGGIFNSLLSFGLYGSNPSLNYIQWYLQRQNSGDYDGNNFLMTFSDGVLDPLSNNYISSSVSNSFVRLFYNNNNFSLLNSSNTPNYLEIFGNSVYLQTNKGKVYDWAGQNNIVKNWVIGGFRNGYSYIVYSGGNIFKTVLFGFDNFQNSESFNIPNGFELDNVLLVPYFGDSKNSNKNYLLAISNTGYVNNSRDRYLYSVYYCSGFTLTDYGDYFGFNLKSACQFLDGGDFSYQNGSYRDYSNRLFYLFQKYSKCYYTSSNGSTYSSTVSYPSNYMNIYVSNSSNFIGGTLNFESFVIPGSNCSNSTVDGLFTYSIGLNSDGHTDILNGISSNISTLENVVDSLHVFCKYMPNNPLCVGGQFNINSGSDISFTDDGSGNINVTVTLYDTPLDDCPDIYYTGNNGLSYHQYFDRVCKTEIVTQPINSSPGESDFLFSGSDLTGLQSQIGLALSGIVGPNFKFYSCPFRSPLRALHLSSIGGLSSFLLDKFFDVNLVGPFNCLLGGILYSETDSVSLGSRLLDNTYNGKKFLDDFPDDVKNTINWLLFAGMVLFFWSFRPKEH